MTLDILFWFMNSSLQTFIPPRNNDPFGEIIKEPGDLLDNSIANSMNSSLTESPILIQKVKNTFVVVQVVVTVGAFNFFEFVW
jgi:hypothetical protein